MATHRRKAAAFAVAWLVLPLLFAAAPAAAAPQPLATTPIDLSLWIHRDQSLSMAGNANEFGSPQPFTTREWRQTDGLQKILCIDGVDIGSGRQGIAVQLSIAFNTLTAGLNITMRFKDLDFVLAEDTFAFARGATPFNTFWNLNFTAGRVSQGCNVLNGHTLALEVTSAATLSTADFRGARIAFKATDPVLPDAHTENSAGPTSQFYPNDLPANRTVMFKGSLGNAFTDALIARVLVQVRDPVGSLVVDSLGTVATGNWSFNWNYPQSLAGAYTTFIQVNDTQGHSYNTTTSFTFVNFGVRLTTQDQVGDTATRYTTPGIGADYELTVTNIGGSPTSVLLTAESVPPLWSTSISSNNIPLEPAASALSIFTVSPNPLVGPGNSTQIVLIAQADSAPPPLKPRATLTTTTIIQSEISITFDPPRTDSTIKLASQASYGTTLRNNGGKTTDIVFNATAPPSGWDRTLDGSGVVVDGSGGWRINNVEAGGERTLTLIVFAPSDSNTQPTFACTLTARSTANASAIATFVATTTLQLGIELNWVTGIKPTVQPGAYVDIQVEINNTDPLNRHTVTGQDLAAIEAPTPAVNPQAIQGIEGGNIDISPPIGCCAEQGSPSGSAVLITVTVQVPAHAKPGTYVITIQAAVDGNPAVLAQVNISVLVPTVTIFALRLNGAPTSAVLPGGTVKLEGSFVSSGNSVTHVNIDAAIFDGAKADDSWTVRFLDASGVDLQGQVILPAYGVVPVNISITASPQAFNGERRDLRITLSVVVTGASRWDLNPAVALTTQFDSTAVLTRMWQAAFLIIAPFVLLAVFAFGLGRRALKGPRAAPPAATSTPAGKPPTQTKAPTPPSK